MRYFPHYTKREQRRHDTRPGITGLAQVSGRNILSWKERLELDVWYVENWSLFLDIKILLLTVIRVFRRSGVHLGPNAAVKKDFDIERLEEIEYLAVKRVIEQEIEQGDNK